MLQRPNVLLMDEPTNHMDMESIESPNLGLERYTGTLIFVSATTGSSSPRWPPRSSSSPPAGPSITRATTTTTCRPGHRLGQPRFRLAAKRAADCACIGEQFGQQFLQICQWYGAVVARAGRFLCDNVNGVFVKLFDRVLNPRETGAALDLYADFAFTRMPAIAINNEHQFSSSLTWTRGSHIYQVRRPAHPQLQGRGRFHHRRRRSRNLRFRRQRQRLRHQLRSFECSDRRLVPLPAGAEYQEEERHLHRHPRLRAGHVEGEKQSDVRLRHPFLPRSHAARAPAGQKPWMRSSCPADGIRPRRRDTILTTPRVLRL